MALITNNISGSNSNSSRVGITGSVIIANVPATSFPSLPTNTTFFVSGSSTDRSAFGGDVVVTGSLAVNGGSLTTSATTFNLANANATTLNIGGGASTATSIGNTSATNTISGKTKFPQGLSGSLTQLNDGTSYLVAGSNVTITSASNGAITISSTDTTGAPTNAQYVTLATDMTLSGERVLTPGTGLTLTDGGAGGTVTLAINDSVVATISGSSFTGAISSTGDVSAGGDLKSTYSAGDEGGQIFLNKPVTNTTLNTGVNIDVYQDKLRFFENGGTSRGFYVDLSTGTAGAGTNLIQGDITAVTAGTGLTGGGTTGAVTLSINDSVVATVSGTTFTGAISAPGITSTAGLTQSGGNVSLAAQTNGNVSIGNDSGITSTAIAGGSSVVLSGAVGTNYTIGTPTGTGTITVGQSTQTNTINIGNATPAVGRIQSINIGANGGTLGTVLVSIGSTGGSSATNIYGSNLILTGSASTTVTGSASATYTIGGETGTGTLTLGRSTASNTINIGNAGNNTANTQTISIGAGTGTSAITIGSKAGTSPVIIQAGTTGLSVSGSARFNQGLSGSHTKLTDGTSYLIGGTGINVTSSSIGSVTFDINDSVVSTVSGTTFTGNVAISSLTAAQVVVAGTGKVLSGTNRMVWNDANSRLALGGNVGTAMLYLTGTTSATDWLVTGRAGGSTNLFDFQRQDGTSIIKTQYNANTSYNFVTSTGAGTWYIDPNQSASRALSLYENSAQSYFYLQAQNADAVNTTRSSSFLMFGARYWNGAASTGVSPQYIYVAMDSTTPTYRMILALGSSTLQLKNDGNIGVNVNPTARLHVAGNASDGTITTLLVKHGVATGVMPVLDVQTSGGTSILYVSGSGLVGVGTTTPTNKLEVAGSLAQSAGNVSIAGQSGGTVVLGNTGGAASLTLDAGTGTIGIGTSASARTVNIATGGAAQTVTVGSQTGTSSLTLDAGTGTVNVATSASARAINIATPATTIQTVKVGNIIDGSNINMYSSGTLGVGIKTHTGYTNSDVRTITGAVTTTNNTPTTIASISGSAGGPGTVYWVEAIFAGHNRTTSFGMAVRYACFYVNTAGTAITQQGSTSSPVSIGQIPGVWSVSLGATGTSISAAVTGAAATTIDWTCSLRYQAVSGSA